MFYLILLAVFLCLAFYLQRKPAKYPPGPPRLPLIGSLPFLSQYKTQFNRINGLSEHYGKICGFYAGNRSNVILSDFEAIKKVYKMEEAANRPFLQASSRFRYGQSQDTIKGILFSSGAQWREQRRFALRNLRDFGFGKASMESMIQHEVSKLCASIQKDIDKPTKIDSKLNIAIVNALWKILVNEELNMDNPEDVRVVNTLNNFIRTSGGVGLLPQIFPILLKLFPEYYTKNGTATMNMIKELCKPYRKNHRETIDTDNPRDFLDVHISAQMEAQPGSTFYGQSGQQNEEINLLDMFLAGAETTSTTITWGILYLLHHPEIERRLQEEMDSVVGRDRLPSLEDEPHLPLMCATIHEIHRSASLVYMGVPHATNADIDVLGYTIPKGSTILANIAQVMHNPEIFKEPDLFNPDRFLDGNGKFRSSPYVIPFLVGKRICLGASLAEKELFLFFSQLVQQFSFKPVPGDKLPSYSFMRRDGTTPGGIIRFCPLYNLVISNRFTDNQDY